MLASGMFELGAEYTDKISGFTGVATGYCQYLSGCNQVLLAPKIKKDGTLPDSQWFDDQRLRKNKARIVNLDNSKSPGFDKPAPKR